MNLSRREMGLVWGTLLMLFSLMLALYVSRNWEAARRESGTREELRQRLRSAQRLIAGRGEAENRLALFFSRLSAHEAGQDVTADLLRDLERIARDTRVTLTRREADRERRVGEIFEVSVTAAWEADLPSLVEFLYALETQGTMRQIRQLTVSSVKEGRLKGSVVVDHAYTRLTGAAPAAAPAAGTEQGKPHHE